MNRVLILLFLSICAVPAYAEMRYEELTEKEKKEAAQDWYQSLDREEKRRVESNKEAYENIMGELEKLMSSMNESERLYIVHGPGAE